MERARMLIVLAAVVLLLGCADQPGLPGLSFQEFKEELQSMDVRGVLGEGADTRIVVLKSRLFSRFGKPERVQQTGGSVFVYYPIADGLVQIEACAARWNGTMQFSYLSCSQPKLPDEPAHPMWQHYLPLDPRSASFTPRHVMPVTRAGATKEKDQTILAWYLKTHDDPFRIEKEESLGSKYSPGRPIYYKYQIYKSGKKWANYRTESDAKKRVSADLLTMAWDLLGDEQRKLRDQWEQRCRDLWNKHSRDHTVKVEEPVLFVSAMRVY